MPEPNDHDLLILMNRDITEMKDMYRDVMEQLKRGNEKFIQITLRDQEIGAAIADLRQNYSRAMLTADQARDGVRKLDDEFDRFKTQLKTIAWVAGPLIGVVVAIATELVKKWLGL